MMWNETDQIGCAYGVCSPEHNNLIIILCNYHPGANDDHATFTDDQFCALSDSLPIELDNRIITKVDTCEEIDC